MPVLRHRLVLNFHAYDLQSEKVEQITDFKERSDRKLRETEDMFAELYNLDNRLLGVFVPRSVIAKRTLYTD